MSIEKMEFDHGIKLRIEYDPDVRPPHEDMDFLGKIAYLTKSREVLGTEMVSRDRMDEIAAGIRSGSLIGLPVYAYVHSGATIRTTPFNDQWDSGQSGFVYVERNNPEVQEHYKGDDAGVLEVLRNEVSTFDDYLTGNVYGFVIEDADGNCLDSCWGYYGLDYCRECAQDTVQHYLAAAAAGA